MSDPRETGKFELAPELAALHEQLAQLTPTAPLVDRDQLMFEAGRAAERAGGKEQGAGNLCPTGSASARVCATGSASARFWPAATAASVLLAALLFWQDRPEPIAQPVEPPAASTVPIVTAPNSLDTWPQRLRATTGYLAVRDAAFARGLGALASEFDGSPSTAAPPVAPATARQLLEELLPDASRQRS